MKFVKLIKADINQEDQKELENFWLDNIEKSVKHNYIYVYQTCGSISAYIDPNADLDQYQGDYTIPGDVILEAIYGLEDAYDKDIADRVAEDIFEDSAEEIEEELSKEDDDFVTYMDQPLKSKVKSVRLAQFYIKESKPYAIYTIVTNQMLNENEMKELKEYMDGQMSDGIGEGFEQKEFKTEEHYSKWDIGSVAFDNPDYVEYNSDEDGEEDEEYDEDDISHQEYIETEVEEDVDVPLYFYVSLWSPDSNSTIKYGAGR